MAHDTKLLVIGNSLKNCLIMTNLLLDTCVWLDLAKSRSEKLLDFLEYYVEENLVNLLVPEIVLTEFERNKDRIINDNVKALGNQIDKITDIIIAHESKDVRDEMTIRLTDLKHKIPRISESISSSVEKIEKLFSTAEILYANNEIKLKAVDRGMNKVAPFHLSKNSIADAIILEIFIDYKINNNNFPLMFITHNKSDFSTKNGNQKFPHEDFEDLFDSINIYYFINLAEALNTIDPEIFAKTKFEGDWKLEARGLSQLLEVEQELEQKIWYNRHAIRAEKIKNGSVKIIERDEYTIRLANSTIVREIWEGALQSAEKIENKFGKENLEFDDFDWGFINGKLSAIRFALGEEWDLLDT